MDKLNKKFRHQLMYINLNRFETTDLNQEEIAKAWVVMFHFRGKSIESLLYD